MKIERAKILGFCPGVRRAIEIAEQNPNSFVTGGDMVHNAAISARLRNEFNVVPAKDLDSIPSGATAIIRAHGIGRTEEDKLSKRGVKIVDATCLNVKKTHEIVERLKAEGRHIFILGEPGHPEAVGILDRAGKNATAISGAADIDAAKIPQRCALVSQTTKTHAEFIAAEKVLTESGRDFESFCTVCSNTEPNQWAAAELAKKCDVMIVAGGKNSTNTKVLAAMSKKLCPDTHMIESAEELRPEWFRGKNLCGIAAGVSTPMYIIEEIEKKVMAMNNE
jgi:4-hydroxy-3-methylbut-2-enyl diphosphate reductase